MAPNPSRLTVRSPPTSMVPAAVAVGCAFTWYHLVVMVSLSRLPLALELPNSGGDYRPRLGEFDRLFQRFYVIGAVMPLAVDEERRGPGDIGQVGGFQVLADMRPPRVLAQVGGEPLGVQAERVRVADQVAGVQRVLVVQQQVVHLPERGLPPG